uniref:Sugar phosphate transporter domain-containing protein n=1 Tax=Cyanoptyche gloeocystis TaxID=77922 RepID=A0A7S2NMD6_9EUKA|mmetsp:Transcript_1017/g.1919  ORF Transcript_1017/g.1919 Transcript_1017/m.1919 type:complete len:333 (+) Transcript_1017:20-1018(+)|eukprot:CAMPEP_0196655274 /NCGR_PEP_ID=MMETSP1086-20130531/5028_1 /TAXON_ID=77921 /ORGANISM="Cyanoptyche  gloeocystis , Strain SAG4.97" /LENGTH=332 /DNA_ID=CAMNT_0041987495 /DNA_START=1 /DNA_END=999 /DNA_ORIENTATION=-
MQNSQVDPINFRAQDWIDGCRAPVISKKKKSSVGTPFLVLANVVCSLGTVFSNKLLFTEQSYSFPLTITFFNFAFNTLLLYVSVSCKAFELKSVPRRQFAGLAVLFALSVVLMNMSAAENSVGFYQLMKIIHTPMIAFIETILHGYRRTIPEVAALSLICFGIGQATVHDVTATFRGATIALIGALVTSWYQTQVGVRSKELNVSGPELSYYTYPLSTIILIPVIPMIEGVGGFLQLSMKRSLLGMLGVSCVASFGLNVTFASITGRTSALLFQVIGHFKTCLVLLIGWRYFDSPMSARQLVGVGIGFTGLIFYSLVKPASTPLKLGRKKTS